MNCWAEIGASPEPDLVENMTRDIEREKDERLIAAAALAPPSLCAIRQVESDPTGVVQGLTGGLSRSVNRVGTHIKMYNVLCIYVAPVVSLSFFIFLLMEEEMTRAVGGSTVWLLFHRRAAMIPGRLAVCSAAPLAMHRRGEGTLAFVLFPLLPSYVSRPKHKLKVPGV